MGGIWEGAPPLARDTNVRLAYRHTRAQSDALSSHNGVVPHVGGSWLVVLPASARSRSYPGVPRPRTMNQI